VKLHRQTDRWETEKKNGFQGGVQRVVATSHNEGTMPWRTGGMVLQTGWVRFGGDPSGGGWGGAQGWCAVSFEPWGCRSTEKRRDRGTNRKLEFRGRREPKILGGGLFEKKPRNHEWRFRKSLKNQKGGDALNVKQ